MVKHKFPAWNYFIDEEKVNSILNKFDYKDRLCPQEKDVLKAFEFFQPEQTKVVILGQDPYPRLQDAMGLAFSTYAEKTPKSLRNIFAEIDRDVGFGKKLRHSNDLTQWAQQGVLLLNSTLTTVDGVPGMHEKIGWQELTDELIDKLARNYNGIVFILWGGWAQKKKDLINEEKHYILETSHPSPMSVMKGFSGCNHFTLCNTYLMQEYKQPIVWEFQPQMVNKKWML